MTPDSTGERGVRGCDSLYRRLCCLLTIFVSLFCLWHAPQELRAEREIVRECRYRPPLFLVLKVSYVAGGRGLGV